MKHKMTPEELKQKIEELVEKEDVDSIVDLIPEDKIKDALLMLEGALIGMKAMKKIK